MPLISASPPYTQQIAAIANVQPNEWDPVNSDSEMILTQYTAAQPPLSLNIAARTINSYSNLDKVYWEIKFDFFGATLGRFQTGSANVSGSHHRSIVVVDDASGAGFLIFGNGSIKFSPGSTSFAFSPDLQMNDVIMFAHDGTNGNHWAGVNGTWYNGGDPATNTNPIANITVTERRTAWFYSGGSATTLHSVSLPVPLNHTIPTGFTAL